MRGKIRRRLFWQVYLTLLSSLVLMSLIAGGIIHLVLGGPPSGMRMHRQTLGVHALEILLAMAVLVGMAAYPVVSRITGRLEALRRSVEAWGAGDHHRRAVVDGRDEIAGVAVSFNAAADRADELLAAHKTLLMHASHELRSPLARLAMAAEIYPGVYDPTRASAMRREIEELDVLVGEILLASRLDFASEPNASERVDCLALAAEETSRAGVFLRPVQIDSSAFDILGSPHLLRRMIRNLIDNGLRHGAPPVEVELDLATITGAPAIAIQVRDHGPGIAHSFRERVFEPFFRPDGWTEEGGGWGLGLSLVRQIARQHGGESSVTTEAGVTTFTVVLPSA
jgi:two-component system OmpR family sensor kinase